MTPSLIVDITVAALLVVTIVYAIILNRRLSAMRRDRDELATVAASFEKATARASVSIAKLKASTEGLQDSIGKAESLRDDLSFLMDRGGSAADRLEAAVRHARKQGAGIAPASMARNDDDEEPVTKAPTVLRAPRRVAAGPAAELAGGHMDAERDLLRAIQAAR